MLPFRHHTPTAVFYGRGQLETHLAAEVARYGRRILLVYGAASIKRVGLHERIITLLRESGIEIVEMGGVEPNPRLTTVQRGIELCRQSDIDLILAAGGGSVIDCAKAIAAGTLYGGDIWDLFSNPDAHQAAAALPLGVILTLPAAGSEINPGMVITNWDTREKLGARAPCLFPRFSFCDAATTLSVPRDQTVHGICDMLSHCIENYFHPTTNTPLQRHLLEAIMQTVLETTPAVLANPQDFAARETIMYCGTMALDGLITLGVQGDWASHAIEHEVSALYDIPHGAGMAIILPHWMEYIVDEQPEQFAALGVQVLGIRPHSQHVGELAHAAIAALRGFFREIGAPTTLSSYGIEAAALHHMAAQAVRFGPIGHMRTLHQDDVYAILRAAL